MRLSSPVLRNGASMPLFPLPASGIALAVMEALNRLAANNGSLAGFPSEP